MCLTSILSALLSLTGFSFNAVQPCNPAVGGPAKSQLVHEVDAMGGEMGKMADRCYLQKRVLNRSKVPSPSSCHRCWRICIAPSDAIAGGAFLQPAGSSHWLQLALPRLDACKYL